ncbi:hypothetical protein Tco_0047823 [Tanacetum coccineum]
MSDLKFADTHNLVVFLEKPTESEGFEGIVDFLNANPIKYTLTVNPIVYCSYIKQFLDTVKAKMVNGEVQLQIITESTIRRDLQLEDAKGTKCVPTTTIFEELTRMGHEKLTQKLTFYKAFFSPQWKFFIHTILQCLSAKTTALNEFSSTMASTIIYLAINQKFNFSKYIFDSMVKNVDSMVKFWMYPRFVQIFANMKKEAKGFSETITPLFQTMIVQAQEEMGEGSANPTDPHHTPTITQPSTSQLQKKQPRRKERKDTKVSQPSGLTESMADDIESVESVPTHSNDPLLSGEDSIKLNELMELCTTLQSRVLALETTKTIQALEIDSLKRKVKKLENKKRSRTHGLKRLYKVGLSAKVISSDDEASLGNKEDASTLGRKILDIDADEDITLDSTYFNTDPDMFGVHDLHGDEVFVETEEPMVNAATTTRTIPVSTATTTVADEVEITLAQTLIEIKSAKPKAKGIVMQELSESTPIISSQQPSQVKGQGSQDKGKANMIESEKPLKKKNQIMYDQESSSKRAGDELEQEKAKKQKIDDDQEKVKMKKLMEVISDEEGVAIDAISLSTKPPSIVYYKIIKEGKIIIYQFIRVDGSLKRYSTVIHMLRNFDREDLETMWKIVKASYGYTRPEEGFERVLWGDLKTMFKHHVEDLVWRINEVFRSILLVFMKLLMKKLDDFEDKYQVEGRIVRIKRLHDDLRVIVAQVAAGTKVTTVSVEELMLLV